MRIVPSEYVFTSLIALSLGIHTPAQAAAPEAEPQESTPRRVDAAYDFSSVREVVAKTLEEAKVPSIAVTVVKDGEIIFQEAFGWADKERRIPATAHTAYSLASITKPMTATAVMKLSESGKLDIDAPVERYLGGIKLTGHAGSTNAVTARRIMAHSAGLPKYGRFYLDGATPAGSQETISKFGMVVYPPNTRFEYSNIGMKILDAAIEQASGASYGDYLKREIFLPLGMKDSAVGLPAGSTSAVRYDSERKPMRFYLTDHPGSGDVWASAHDVARFLAFHMGTPLAGQQAILSRETVQAMQRPASAKPMPAPGEPRRDIGANWILSTVNGHPQVWHSGGQPGVSSFMSIYPDQKLGIVLLANSSAPLGRVGQAIRAVVAPEVMPPESESPPPVAQPIPFRGLWTGTVTNHAGERPISIDFAESGEIKVKLGDHETTVLKKPTYSDGSLSGQFSGTSNMPEAQGTDHQMAIDVVRDGDELVGQLVAQGMSEQVAFMLPSFVRLRKVEAVSR